MRVLITGATGFVGSHTARALVRAGHEVRALVRNLRKLDQIESQNREFPQDHLVGDMTDVDVVERALDGCDAVVHAAAFVNLDRKRAQEVIDTNLRGVETVVGGAHRAGIDRIVYVSSTAALFDPSRGAIHPQSPVAPSATSAYGLSKAQGELYVRGLQAAGACVKTTYPAGVIGPDDPDLSEGNQGLKFLLEGWPRIATSGGLQSIDVRDLANIHVALLEGEPGPGRYVAAGRYLEWHEVLDLLEEVTDQRVARMSVGGGWVRFSGRLADWLKQYIDIGVPLSQEGMIYATLWPGADDSKTLSELGFGYRPAAETYRATVRWLFDAGHIDAATAGVLGQEGL